jgi:hypothetical protein
MILPSPRLKAPSEAGSFINFKFSELAIDLEKVSLYKGKFKDSEFGARNRFKNRPQSTRSQSYDF